MGFEPRELPNAHGAALFPRTSQHFPLPGSSNNSEEPGLLPGLTAHDDTLSRLA
jgi:hypothetical protein